MITLFQYTPYYDDPQKFIVLNKRTLLVIEKTLYNKNKINKFIFSIYFCLYIIMYEQKYLKYKTKYLNTKLKQHGGGKNAFIL